MKKYFTISLAMLLAFKAFSQNEGKNVVKIGTTGFAYERAFGDHFSAVLYTPISFAVAASSSGYTASAFGYGLGLDLRFYVSKSRVAPAGFYLSPGVYYLTGNLKEDDGMGNTYKSKYTAFVAKGVVGYQWVWNSGFSLDLNAGPAYLDFKYNDTSGIFQGLKTNTVTAALGASIGYAF